MGSYKELITLQFGNVANHVGAHYWNLQVGVGSIDGFVDVYINLPISMNI